jgi:hypothetical protein
VRLYGYGEVVVVRIENVSPEPAERVSWEGIETPPEAIGNQPTATS